MNKILLIDDDENFLQIYSEILQTNGYDIQTAANGIEGLEKIKSELFSVVIIDMLMPHMNGLEVLKRIRNQYPSIIVIVMTCEGSINGAVDTMTLGAYTYMVKPVDIDALLNNVKRAVELYKLNSENTQLKNKIEFFGREDEWIGSSTSIKKTMEEIEKVGPTNSTVLISGESGTGKEIIANFLHRNSLNKEGPLIKVNCGALSESLLESELFGHEKGAFTGAIATKQGRFEMANGGTLFLDEIGEIPPKIQVKLLRVLQEREFERVGGTNTIHCDFRLICATNKDLPEEVKNGNFREDLYYRINVIPLKTIPLRERKENVPILMRHFVDYYCNEMKKPFLEIDKSAMDCLVNYNWHGNVRELKNLAERLVVFSEGNTIVPSMLPEEIYGMVNLDNDIFLKTYQEAKNIFEQKYLINNLQWNDWNISKTANQIGLSRKNLHLKIKQLGIEK